MKAKLLLHQILSLSLSTHTDTHTQRRRRQQAAKFPHRLTHLEVGFHQRRRRRLVQLDQNLPPSLFSLFALSLCAAPGGCYFTGLTSIRSCSAPEKERDQRPCFVQSTHTWLSVFTQAEAGEEALLWAKRYISGESEAKLNARSRFGFEKIS